MRKIICLAGIVLMASCESKQEKAMKRFGQLTNEISRARDYKNSIEYLYIKYLDANTHIDSLRADSLLKSVDSEIKKLENEQDSVKKIAYK